MFTILTDSSANLTEGLIHQYDIQIIPLNYTIDGMIFPSYSPHASFNYAEFFYKLRGKAAAGTSLVNAATFESAFTAELEQGHDVLYIGLSSGISGTFQAARIAAAELADRFPDSSLYIVDTKTGGMAQGLLVCEAAKSRLQGKTLLQTKDEIEQLKTHASIYFTVDDMFHLKRGGRLSGAAAILSTVLNIRPIMSDNAEGKIVLREKVRGRKAALERLAEIFICRAPEQGGQTVGINHGDCAEDAERLAGLIKNTGLAKNIIIGYLDPVLGVHAGPGAITLSFLEA